MKLFKAVAVISTLALLVLAFTPGLRAGNDVWNKKTTIMFSQPFEIPGGQILPAGSYVFKLLDSPYDRDIVQIFNEDETHIYATVLAIPNHHLQATDTTVLKFEERASGSPQAIKAWFHPGDTWGQEFVYPKQRAIELAKLVNEPVPSMPTELTPSITTAATSPKEELRLEKAPIKAEEPSGEELPINRAFAPTVASLPKTASALPLVGLIGVLCLAAAFGLLLVTRRAG